MHLHILDKQTRTHSLQLDSNTAQSGWDLVNSNMLSSQLSIYIYMYPKFFSCYDSLALKTE